MGPSSPVQAPVQVIVGADVRTEDARARRAEALAWRDGEILAVGTREEVLRAAGSESFVHDARGATVVPGFVDAHHHPGIAALYGGQLRLAGPDVTDIAALQAKLAAASRALPPGRWLVATEWDEAALRERRHPTRAELDDAVPDRPLFAMHYTCHRAVANGRALALAGIDAGTADPAGGAIGRGRRGEPDGLLIERGMSRVEALARASLVARDAEGFFERLSAHHAALLAEGITRVVDATVPGDVITLYREAARRGLVRVPTVMMPVSTTGYLETPWEALDGPVTGTEEGPLTFGPVKLVFDGAPVCSMCLSPWQSFAVFLRTVAISLRQRSLDAVRATLSVRPSLGRDGKLRSGISIYRRGDADTLLRAAAERGFGVATHAIGNEAIDVALSAYEAVGAQLGGAAIPRIEHATFLGPELARRIAGGGFAVVTQPHLVTLPAVASAPRVPGIGYLPLRLLLDAGVRLAASSDYPVAGFSPLDGIRSAVTRLTSRGEPHDPDQRVTVDEALTMYTRTAADVSGCLDRCGTLEVGKRADVVILSGPLSTQADLERVKVRATVLGGEVVHGALPASADAPSA